MAADPEYNPGHFGNVGRNTLTSPGFATLDFSTEKTFRVTENHRVQFRGEVYNIPNHPNWRDDDANMINPTSSTQVAQPGTDSNAG